MTRRRAPLAALALSLASTLASTLALTLIVAPAAHATPSASATIGNFKVTLIDLQTGGTPYFQYMGGHWEHSIGAEYMIDNNAKPVYGSQHTATYAPIELDIGYQAPGGGLPRYSAGGSISGASLDDLVLHTYASAAGVSALGYSGSDAQVYDKFRLSPQTTLLLSFDATLDTRLGEPNARGGAGASVIVEAYAWGQDIFTFNFNQQVVAGRPDTGSPATRTGVFELRNDGYFDIDLILAATIRSGTSTRDVNVPLPVPEPASYAMLLAGLGVAGAAAVRRRRRA